MPFLFFFGIATATHLVSTFFINLPLLAYAPYLSLVFLKRPLKNLLWQSLFCGLSIDILQSSLPFGYSALIYLIVSLILYKQKWVFFHDKLLSLAFFSSLFSLLHSLLQILFFDLTKKNLLFSWKTLLSELLLMPLGDGLYAFLAFTLPYLLYLQVKQKGFRFLFMEKLR
ncbi:MAG: hypothetical protein FJZ63_06855 [Chlamydiae bacterium]|nr:hypothetical protein [Chlamydiota bacterium]